MIRDLTIGKPSKVLWSFSIPMFISVIFQQLYQIADSAIAGRFAGEEALAAIGSSFPITMIFMSIAIGSNIGCSVVISHFFGAKQYKTMKTAITTTLLASTIISIVLSIIGLLCSKSLMQVLNTPADIFDDSSAYLSIYIIGFVFLFLYNACTGIFTSLGDSKTPLYFLIISSIGNVLLDLLFVAVFDFGVKGVALATFIAQGISSILALITLRKRVNQIKTEEELSIFSFYVFKRISALAVPSILQQSFISIGNLFILFLINGFGSPVIAGYSAAVKLNTFAVTSLTTLGNGVSSFTAQNLGAGKDNRIEKGFLVGTVMAISITMIFFVSYFFFGKQMISIFMKRSNSNALLTGILFLKIVAPFYFCISIKLIADGVLRGSGSMGYFMISTFSDLVVRVIVAYILVIPFKISGIFFSWPIGWVVGTILSFQFYYFKKWKY